MADEASTDVFHARIAATDDASKTLEDIRKRFHGLANEADRVGTATEHMHRPHTWIAIGEHVDLAREHFGGLRASVGEVGESVTELLPALAALGAVGTFAELFETAERTAEAYAQLEHAASAIGTTADKLQDLRSVAYLTDTSVESMEGGINKLNRAIATAASGKNKDAAALFSHLGISLRDATGHLRDGTEMLPQLADAFEHTSSAAMRTRMAMAVMGRGGVEMVPMLRRGGEAIRDLLKESRALEFKPTDEQRQGAIEFADDMKKLKLAGGGLQDAIGATLAPILTPLIDQAKEFLIDVRPEVQAAISKGGHEFVDFMQHIPWHALGQDVRAVKNDVVGFVDQIGGAKRAVEILGGVMALKGVMFLAEPIMEAGKLARDVGALALSLSTTLVRAWFAVGAAAEGAAVKEAAATKFGLTGVRAVGAASAVSAGEAVAHGGGAGAVTAAAGAAAGRFNPSAYGQRQAVNPQADAATAGQISARAIGAGLNLGVAAYGALEGTDLDKEMIRRMPALARNVTHAQFDMLPEHIPTPYAPLGITDDPAHPGFIERQYDRAFGPSPYASPARDNALPFKVETESKVVVEFVNAPPGTSAIATTTSGQAATSAAFTGKAWADQYPMSHAGQQ